VLGPVKEYNKTNYIVVKKIMEVADMNDVFENTYEAIVEMVDVEDDEEAKAVSEGKGKGHAE
jgi:hypothetical protein